MPSGPFDYLNRGNPDNPNYFDNPPPDTGNLPDPSDELARGFGGNPADNGNGASMPTIPGTGPDPSSFDFSKFDLTGIPDWVKNMIPGMSADPAKALLVPSWLAAYKQWQDAGKYKETAAEAAKYGDPFGAANRAKYQGLLDASYTHPEDVLKDPGHMATIKSGLDAVGRTDASKGYLGSGNMEVDLAKYATDENAKYLDSYRKGLEPLTGSQFNPAAAGDFLMKGNEQAISSQNAALQSLFLPFMANTTQNYLNNNPSNPNGNNPNSPNGKTQNNPLDDPNLANAVTTGNKAAIDAAISKGIQFVKLPDGSTADLFAVARSGYRTGEPDFMDIHHGGNPYPGYTNVPSDPPPGEVPVGPPDLNGPPSPPPPDFPEPEIPDYSEGLFGTNFGG